MGRNGFNFQEILVKAENSWAFDLILITGRGIVLLFKVLFVN